MYALIQNTEKGYLPSVVNMNSEDYPTLIMAGYEQLETGSRKEMNEIFEDLIIEFASNND